jgi:YidC/Oxa1 family membrane protein insertase
MINLDPHGQNKNFFDSKTLLATLMILLSFGGWFYYISKKYPTPQTPAQVEKKIEKGLETIPTMEKTNIAKEDPVAQHIEQGVHFDSESLSFDIANRGMGLKNITLKKFKERDGAPVELAKNLQTRFLTELTVEGKDTYFNVQKTGDYQFVGTASSGGTTIKKTLTVDPMKYLINVKTEFGKLPQSFEVHIASHVEGDQTSSMFKRNYDKESVYVDYGSNETARKEVDPKVATIFDKEFNAVSIAAMDRHYFTAAVIDKSDIAPSFSALYLLSSSEILGTLKYTIPQGAKSLFENNIFVGPKEMKTLTAIDPRLAKTINFGYFGFIGKPILRLLKFLYSVIGNYGVAIILVTLLIRLILLPINVSSYKSMKKMQEIQPQLKLIKEKYKNDPQRVQVETMSIMKQNKVNPIGGCLPMLLQFPIFIALYNVLAQSIELYQAPFMLWIHDLSMKDPYYVLPILMGATMFVQQKITPTAMDPAQAKVMQFMPLFFSFLMFSLPSGLTLYIFVSTLFGIIQQYMVMKDKKQTQMVQQTLSK